MDQILDRIRRGPQKVSSTRYRTSNTKKLLDNPTTSSSGVKSWNHLIAPLQETSCIGKGLRLTLMPRNAVVLRLCSVGFKALYAETFG